MRSKSFLIGARALLIYNLGVILWGAYVRATGSGAGCGNHWPLCQGVVVPQNPQIATTIEFTHRLSSGLVLLFALGLYLWSRRLFAAGQATRWAAGAVLFFTCTEALLGAGLVLFGLVANNASVARAVSVALHLSNTFLLLFSLALTAELARGVAVPRLRGDWPAWLLGAAMFGVLLVGMSGAVTALGDTLFPAQTLAQGIAQDQDPAAHFLIRLRAIHPVLAVFVTVLVLTTAGAVRSKRSASVGRWPGVVMGLALLQVMAGAVNLSLLAPVPMQLFHLLLADLVWLALAVLAIHTLSSPGLVEARRLPLGGAHPMRAE
jgi:heme A synthase